jgi:hypothetical protein
MTNLGKQIMFSIKRYKNEKIESSSSKRSKSPRGKSHKESSEKTTVGIYLSKKTVERARFHNLNLSRISEQALISILDYLETQNKNQSSEFLGEASFPKEGSMVPRAGLEPATSGDITRQFPQTPLFLIFVWVQKIALSGNN